MEDKYKQPEEDGLKRLLVHQQTEEDDLKTCLFINKQKEMA